MNRDEAFQQYQDALEAISEQSRRAQKEARAILNQQLEAMRITAHEELKAIRAISQKTKGTNK